MRTKKFVAFATTLLLVALAVNFAVAAADQHSGTWKMNPAKSKYSPGPAAKIVNLKIKSDENGIKIDAEGTDGDGNPTHVRYDAKFDGKDYPVTGLPYADTVSGKAHRCQNYSVYFEKRRPGGDDRGIDGLQLRENAHFDIQGQGRAGA